MDKKAYSSGADGGGAMLLSRQLPTLSHAAAALLAFVLLLPLAVLGTPPLLVAVAFAVAATCTPSSALLVVTAFLPLAPVALPLVGIEPAAADGILLAFISGAFTHAALRPGDARAPRALAYAAAAFSIVVVASFAVQMALAGVVVTPAGLPHHLIETWKAIYIRPSAAPAVVAALETIALMALVVLAAGWTSKPDVRASVIRTAVAAGAAAGLLCAIRVFQIALRTGAAARALPGILTSVRISGPFSDPNAAGSYFVMLLVPALFKAVASGGRARIAWAAASGALAFGLWTSGSRAAVLVAMATLAVAATLRPGHRRRSRYLAAAGGVAMTLLVLSAFPNPILTRTVSGALGIRAEMARVAVAMWKTDPWIGVGVGTFYDRSGAFVADPLVKSLYGRENAHNNFLQILAELGLIGLTSFVLILWTAAPPIDGIGPVAAGLGAFLVTCLAGHPLLLPEVAGPFWILAGTAAARNASSHNGRRIAPVAAIVAVAAIIGIVPSYRQERAVMNLEHLGSGVSAWQLGPDGVRYRSMRGSCRVFAPRDAPQIAIPMRAASNSAIPVTVWITVEGRPADRVEVANDWRVERLQVPADDEPAFLSVDIVARDSSGAPAALHVGRVNAVDVH